MSTILSCEVPLSPRSASCWVFYFLFRVDRCDNYVLLEAPAQRSKNSKHAPAKLIGAEFVIFDLSMRNATGNARVKRI